MPLDKQFNVDEALTRAMEAFWAHGYEATSMQDLVTATGVNRASLYATYGDKRALFLAAVRKYDREVRADALSALARCEDPRAAMAALFDRFISQTDARDRNWGCLLTNSALELAAHDPEIARIVNAAQAEIEDFFRRLIERGQATGRFRASLSAPVLARQGLAALLGVLVMIRSRPDPQHLRAVRDGFLESLQ